ncbi:MAG: HEAT repeat domain-containing protein [Akkermansiaceae bacterium]
MEKEHQASEIPELIHALKHGDKNTRWHAAGALNEIGPLSPKVVPALLEALWKIDPEQAPRIVPTLIARLEEQRNPGKPNASMDHSFFLSHQIARGNRTRRQRRDSHPANQSARHSGRRLGFVEN